MSKLLTIGGRQTKFALLRRSNLPAAPGVMCEEGILKSLSEKIKWYREPETRKWKRIWHCMELSLNALLAMAVLIVMQIYGDGSKLQYPLVIFTIGVALSSACLASSVFQSVIFKRWQIQVVTLGLGCGMGISALAALAILELQIGST